MFAKVWDVTKRLWFDVVRPFFQKVYSWITELRAWLKAKLAPVFKLLTTVREHIRGIYKTFVRPILDAIEMARGMLKLLELLHIPFAKALDRYLAQFEQVLETNFYKLLSFINRVTDVVNSVVGPDLLFRRVPFLKSLARDTPDWVRMWWNAQMAPRSADELAQLSARTYHRADPVALKNDLAEFLNAGTGTLAPIINELVPTWFGLTKASDD
jgi:hypothetical protein